MEFLKQSLRKTFVYDIYQIMFAIIKSLTWTGHDAEMISFYSQFISPNDLCFDIGAHIGNRTKIFLKLGAKVVAIEPQNDCARALKIAFHRNKNLRIVQKAVGSSEGEAEFMVSNASTLSSLSQEWIARVNMSGRFSEYSWDNKQIVQITTLDKLISQFGMPAFIKVDVEGFEYEVVKGLSKSVNTLSLEFTPEYIESTFNCLFYLERLGDINLNYSLAESMKLALNKWVSTQEMIKILSRFSGDNTVFGDIYIQFIN